MKLSDIITTIQTKIVADKRIAVGILAAVVAIVSVLGYIGYQEVLKRWAVPRVSGANFSMEYRKIPFDTKSIDITFSTPLDPNSLTSKNVTLSPFVEGKASIRDGNTVSYTLDKKLVIGETYVLALGSDIKSLYGKELGGEQSFTIEAIA